MNILQDYYTSSCNRIGYRMPKNDLQTITRRPIYDVSECTTEAERCLFKEWLRVRQENLRLPFYSDFDILNIDSKYIRKICVTSLEGRPRRFFIRIVGSEIEEQNGFYGNKKFLNDTPLKNKFAMMKEFSWALKLEAPVYSEGFYMGKYEYIKQVNRMIAPYILSDNEFVFVYTACFHSLEWQEPVTQPPPSPLGGT